MKRGELAVKLERWEPLAPCAACFLLTAVLCGAQLFGGYAPFALGLVAAAGSGKRGLAALLGAVAGALVFLDFSHALRTLAVAVLLYTANNAFCETRWYRSRRFLPAMTALMYLAVELVYLLQAGADRAALCLLSIALAVLAAVCARAVLEGKTMNEEQRQAALLAFSAFSELKHIFLVDEDVDCFDISDVLWAMNTRFQGDADIITIPGVRCHPLDPSNDPACSPSIRDHGIACKTIFDCTVPYDQKERFRRARFMEVDPEKWIR